MHFIPTFCALFMPYLMLIGLSPVQAAEASPTAVVPYVQSSASYMTAIVQVLYQIPDLGKTLLQLANFGHEIHGPISSSLVSLFSRMQHGGFNPDEEVVLPLILALNDYTGGGLLYGEQIFPMDSAEMIAVILNALSIEMEGFFDDVFKVQMIAQVNDAAPQDNSSNMLNLMPPQHFSDTDSIALQDLVRRSFDDEVNFSETFVRSTVKKTLKSLPPFIILNVNRASNNGGYTNFAVDFPLNGLIIKAPRFACDDTYDLIAAVIPYGAFGARDKYKVLLKDAKNKWLEIDKTKAVDKTAGFIASNPTYKKNVSYLVYTRRH